MTIAERLIEIHLANKISGAVFDFLGYLTTREDDITVGRYSDCTPILDRFVVWAEKRGLDIDDADMIGWDDPLQHDRTQEYTI